MTCRHWGPTLALVAVSACAAAACRAGSVEAARSQPAYEPTATIKDLMDAIVDPSADVVWNSVATTVGSTGTDDKVPRSDEEWAEVRQGAIRLVEASNLLLIPGRHVARPGEKSETPGVELEPEQMEALLTQDRNAWNSRVSEFHTASLEALGAIDAKDSAKLFEVGDRLDAACESCHRQYWYPNEKIPALPSDVPTRGE